MKERVGWGGMTKSLDSPPPSKSLDSKNVSAPILTHCHVINKASARIFWFAGSIICLMMVLQLNNRAKGHCDEEENKWVGEVKWQSLYSPYTHFGCSDPNTVSWEKVWGSTTYGAASVEQWSSGPVQRRRQSLMMVHRLTHLNLSWLFWSGYCILGEDPMLHHGLQPGMMELQLRNEAAGQCYGENKWIDPFIHILAA